MKSRNKGISDTNIQLEIFSPRGCISKTVEKNNMTSAARREYNYNRESPSAKIHQPGKMRIQNNARIDQSFCTAPSKCIRSRIYPWSVGRKECAEGLRRVLVSSPSLSLPLSLLRRLSRREFEQDRQRDRGRRSILRCDDDGKAGSGAPHCLSAWQKDGARASFTSQIRERE